MKIALVNVGQETNDFNPTPTTLRDFKACGLFEGCEVVDRLATLGEVGGFLDAVRQSALAVETVPIIRGWSTPGGRITAEAFRFFQDRIEAGLKRAGRIDGLMIQLHGACAADGIDDVEGAQLALCRSILGPDIPIVLALDHHDRNVTRMMVENSTAIIGHRTQPHDTFDTGKVAGQLLIRILAQGLKPVMAFRKLRLLSHQEQFLTSKPPMKTWFDRARAMEADPRVLQAANFPMQPWLDVAEGGWATVVVTDGDRQLAGRLADELADLAWSMRDAFQVKEALPVDVAVRRADQAETGLVLLSDTGDTVFGGAAGDSNLILEAMLRLDIGSLALVPMIDPGAAVRLFDAGVGAEVTIALGGQASRFFEPLIVTGKVRAVGGGMVKLADGRTPEIDMGRSVIFDIGSVTMLITELRGVAGNMPEVYRALGVEPADYKMAVLKTASNFQYFASLSSQVIRVDTRGPGQSDIAGLPWRRLPRPIYPLEILPSWRADGTKEQSGSASGPTGRKVAASSMGA
jgi:microcystin degradation protein MlrC